MRRLVAIAGVTRPAELELEPPVLLGRAREADLVLFDETASRQHAEIRDEEGRTVLFDLGSQNGILLNGEAVSGSAALFDGDEIRIGAVCLRYVVGAGADRETVAVPAGDRVEAAVDPDAADPAADAGEQGATRRLRLVCDGAAACADAGELDRVPAVLLGIVVDTFEPDRASVILEDRTGDDAVVAAHPAGASAPTSLTLRQRVLEAGEAVLIRDARDSEFRRTAQSLVASRFRSTLAAPLKTSEGVLGFVAVEAEAPDRFTEEDLRALAATARQAALAMRNLRRLSFARAEADRVSRVRSGGADDILGEHPSIEELRSRIARLGDAGDSSVLITGETGTGKELVARNLHVGSPRRDQPFVALNCAALVEGLLESELFGHEKGAFTGAERQREGRIVEAARGTLFLDEVGELPPGLQAKLLRVLSEGTFTRVGGKKTLKVACRIVAATNRDLAKMVEEGGFRRDLYHRLAVLDVHVPPLKDRGADVELIAEAALERLAHRLGRRTPRLADDARAALLTYAWPGNVRELFNVLERALVLLEGDTVTAADLPLEVRTGGTEGNAGSLATEVITIREAEKRAVRAALEATGGKKGRAAELLGISWPTLNRKIREYGLGD